MGTYATYCGRIQIPDEKKQEFNKSMIKLLQLGGMVNFSKVNLYDKEIKLIYPVELDKEGKCRFHYNYFEDASWETAGFDSNTNKLWSEKIGSYEFNFVICAGYFLTELYSENYGWVSENGDILNYPDYVQWINYILDKDFSLKKRFSLWKLYESFCIARLENGYSVSELNYEEVYNFVIKGYELYMGGTELADIIYIANGTDDDMANAPKGSYAAEIYSIRKSLEEFYKKNPKNGQSVIWSMLTLPKEEREGIIGTEYDDLARISLRVAARAFVYLSAEILGNSFWDEWKKIYKSVYQDEEKVSYVSHEVAKRRDEMQSASLGKMKTSEFLRNDSFFVFYDTPDEIMHKGNYYISDDDLMYWWDGTEKVELSTAMIEQISKWKKDYDDILACIKDGDFANYDMLRNLIEILDKTDDYYKRIFAFKNMFYEFLENNKDVRYIAAIKLFEKVIEDNKEAGKIIEKARLSWSVTSKNVTFNEGRVTIKRFLSFMANNMLRNQYFGF